MCILTQSMKNNLGQAHFENFKDHWLFFKYRNVTLLMKTVFERKISSSAVSENYCWLDIMCDFGYLIKKEASTLNHDFLWAALSSEILQKFLKVYFFSTALKFVSIYNVRTFLRVLLRKESIIEYISLSRKHLGAPVEIQAKFIF